MTSTAGKTAPRLIEDLLRHDPLHPPPNGRNVLIDPAPKLEENRPPPITLGVHSCRHKYMTKPAQSQIPPFDTRPESSSYYKVSSFCADCRTHVDLEVDYRAGHETDRPCPNQDYPLHHFRYLPSTSAVANASIATGRRRPEQENQRSRFRCSSPTCPALVTVTIKPPRLSGNNLALLTDQALITTRVQAVLDAAPERLRGYTVPDPVRVLGNLRQYLTDAMRDPEPKKVNVNNKRFLTSLGEPCRSVLEYLGFEYLKEDTPEGPQHYWQLPRITDEQEGMLYQDDSSTLVDDVDKEIMILIDALTLAEKGSGQRTVTFHPLPSMKDFERSLGSLNYDKEPSSRRPMELTGQDSPFHASLGALQDFADTLLIFAYERQRLCDPENAPYYFDCLQEIARQRGGEALETKVVLMESTGEISSKAILEAYQYFQISPTQIDLDDEYIIGCFHSRASASPLQIESARQQLRVIGVARHSDSILSVASNRITTYDQALVWLGAEEATNDDYIISLLRLKLLDGKADLQICRHAATLIAKKRNSKALSDWLHASQSGDVEMDIGQSYNRLGISDRTLEDETIIMAYEIRLSEASPVQIEELRAALAAIGKGKGSQKIAAYLKTGQVTDQVSPEWPVGLENIGNTCYLNSLLQFYFTVKPLRDLILNFDQYEMESTPENLRRKRVGSRKVTPKEVERAKKFAYELQGLFRNLISAPASAITPERELARLTLIKSSDEETFRRRSLTSSQVRPGLGELNGVPIHGPVGPPESPSTMDVDPHSDNASETTLIDQPPPYDDRDVLMQDAEVEKGHHTSFVMVDAKEQQQQKRILEDKENHPPLKTATTTQPAHQENVQPLHEAGDSKMNMQGPTSNPQPDSEGLSNAFKADSGPLTPPPEASAPPDCAPPVPPRPAPSSSVQKPVDELELGAQQDVTEVIGNVMFQLECAMKADSIDSNGEQQDEIKHLFYGRSKAQIEANSRLRTNEEYFADIKINVASGPCDIYASLDGAFDVQQVSLEDGSFPQYTSIAQLPPILQIHVQRVQYDKESKKMYKSDSHLKLRETIYLDRYMDSRDPSLLQRRRETWRWKDELKRLEARRKVLTRTDVNMTVPEMLHLTKDWLSEFQSAGMDDLIMNDPTLPNALATEANRVKRELDEIDTSIADIESRLERQFSDLQALPYRLQSVFIHRGTATFGHYWIYIYDFARRLWRKYNDGYVTEVTDEREIYEQDATYPATPYYLVYVQASQLDALVDPVCRDIVPVPAPAPPPLPPAEQAPDPDAHGGADADAVSNVNWGGADDAPTQDPAVSDKHWENQAW